MKTVVSLIASCLALTAMSPQASNDAIWSKYGDQLAAQGITKPMHRQAMLWVEQQYLIGMCLRYIPADDRKFWREWWKNTPLEKSEIGRAILKAGDATFLQGAEDSLRQPLSAAHCQRVANSWRADMKKAQAEPEPR